LFTSFTVHRSLPTWRGVCSAWMFSFLHCVFHVLHSVFTAPLRSHWLFSASHLGVPGSGYTHFRFLTGFPISLLFYSLFSRFGFTGCLGTVTLGSFFLSARFHLDFLGAPTLCHWHLPFPFWALISLPYCLESLLSGHLWVPHLCVLTWVFLGSLLQASTHHHWVPLRCCLFLCTFHVSFPRFYLHCTAFLGLHFVLSGSAAVTCHGSCLQAFPALPADFWVPAFCSAAGATCRSWVFCGRSRSAFWVWVCLCHLHYRSFYRFRFLDFGSGSPPASFTLYVPTLRFWVGFSPRFYVHTARSWVYVRFLDFVPYKSLTFYLFHFHLRFILDFGWVLLLVPGSHEFLFLSLYRFLLLLDFVTALFSCHSISFLFCLSLHSPFHCLPY